MEEKFNKLVEKSVKCAVEGRRRLDPRALEKYFALSTDPVASKAEIADAFYNSGKYFCAGKLYAGAGKPKKAEKCAKLCAREHDHQDAARIYLLNGMKKDAAREFEKAQEYSEAAEIYLDLGKMENAARMLEKAGRWAEAIEMYLQLGLKKDVLRCAEEREEAGTYTEAADIYLKLGMRKKASEMLILAGEIERAFAIFRKEEG